MPARRLRFAAALLCLLLLSSCSDASAPQGGSPTATSGAVATATASPTPTPIPTPIRYTSRILLRHVGHPDDLAFDAQGHLLFSDEVNGTISRLNADGSVTVLARGLPGPEGMVSLPDGTLIVAAQETHQMLSLAPGAARPTLLRKLPGTNGSASCKHGVDGIGLDPTTNTIIVPDSPTGEVYRMSLDGKTLTLLASGMARPVGAVVDAQGNIYVADECGAAIWRVTPAGEKMRIDGVKMPDEAVFDPQGNLLVIDLAPQVHALIRLSLTTGQKETLDNKDFIEPQGLVIDGQGHVFVSDDAANIIVAYTPV